MPVNVILRERKLRPVRVIRTWEFVQKLEMETYWKL